MYLPSKRVLANCVCGLIALVAVLVVAFNGATLTVDPPDKKGGPLVIKPPTIQNAEDLKAASEDAGFGGRLDHLSVRHFVEYGSAERTQQFARADQFDRPGIRKEMEAHQAKAAKQAFALRGLPIQVPDRGDFEAKGLAVVTRLGFRLHQMGSSKDVRSKFLKAIHLSRADMRESWFLTKDKSLARCQNAAEARAVEKNGGSLYHPDSLTSDLGMILTVDQETAKTIGRAPQNYSIDVVVDGLRFAKPFEWGYYLRSALIEADWNCDPLTGGTGVEGLDAPPKYFRVEAEKAPLAVTAYLVAVNLRDAKGTSVASYLADAQYDRLLLNPLDRLPELLKALGKDEGRDVAGHAITEMGLAAVPPLLRALQGADVPLRIHLLGVMRTMGPKARSAIPVLFRLRADPTVDRSVRDAAAEALEKVADAATLKRLKESETRLRVLIDALKDRTPAERLKATTALANLGVEAAPAAATLVDTLADPVPAVRTSAATVLVSMGSEAVAGLTGGLQSKNLSVRQGAVQLLGLLGSKAKEAVPNLVELLKDRNLALRLQAAQTLGRIGPDAKEAMPLLLEMAKSRDPQTRAIADAAVQAVQSPVLPK